MPHHIEPSPLSMPDIEALAVYTAEVHDAYDPSGQLRVESLVKSLGGVIHNEPGFWAERPLVVDGPDSFVITMPTHTYPEYDRFAISRLIGHLQLHVTSEDGNYRPAVFHRTDNSGAGLQAWYFAHSMLMRMDRFTEEYTRHSGDPAHLKKVFLVGDTAVRDRSKMLQDRMR